MIKPKGRQLTDREKEVLKLVALGKSNFRIAKELNISYYTARAHVSSILEKLKATGRLVASLEAIKSGLIDFDD